MHTLNYKVSGILVELNQITTLVKDEALVPVSLQGIVDKYKAVFNMPSDLPPVCGHEHSIVLKEGSSPITVPTCRYPHFQKIKIEQLINEMLAVGIIEVSNSLFLSLVLSVKKKDSFWWFYVDYRALNKATVLDKYPIPVIDELLDELHGAQIFSKLDLKSE